MWNNSLQTLLVGTIMAVGVSLSGCDSSKDDAQKQDADMSEQTVADDALVQDNAAPKADLDGATAQQGTQVKYDVAGWGTKNVASLTVDNLDEIKATFGKVMSTDENSLDYASNPAAKYRFMDTDAPYLDLIDSEKYLELGWYFANPTDSDKEKEISQNHAEKAHKLARQLMGDEGGQLISDMLNGQIIKNKVIGGQKIELAKCEFYSCMLVINKSAAQTDKR
jgi:nitrous oxide reductase accessory protein NosL